MLVHFVKTRDRLSLFIRCSHNQNCSIPASTNMFGDPCPGTHKYLEAHYQCLPGKFTFAVVVRHAIGATQTNPTTTLLFLSSASYVS